MSGVQQAVFQNQRSFGPALDAQFNYVTMLLHGDGTNGAQNNTFLDSSTNAFSITRNGNATQGSFGPYGSNWSNFFDGTTDYLTAPAASIVDFGTGDFTVEAWFNSASTVTTQKIIDNYNGNNNPNATLLLNLDADGKVSWYAGQTSVIASSSTFSVGVWNYVLVSRVSGTTKMFLNGTQVGSVSDTRTYAAGYTTVGIGAEPYSSGGACLNGYISNLRVVKGSGVTSSTIPTTPSTAITNTVLLTCQSNRFIDNSSNAYTISIFGNTSVQRFNPFGASTAYSTSVIGGSGHFDGDGDYLSLASNSAFQFGTGDFTVEGWFYQTADNTYPTALELGPHVSGNAIVFLTRYGSNAAIYSNGFYGGTAAALNQWNHIAWVRSSGSLKIYVNGVSPAGVAFTNNLTDTSTGIGIGDSVSLISASYDYSGYMSNMRVVKGTAVYTANFTPPTTPLTAISGTSLLANFTNGAIFDNAMMNDLETVGNAQISTSVKKYGTGSMAFDGTGDYLKPNMATPNLYAFGSGDFTIEFWGYILQTTPEQMFIDWRPAGTQTTQPLIYVTSAGVLAYYVSAANRITGATLSTSTWYHIAVSRSGTSTKMFLNGTQTGSTYTDTTVYTNVAGRPVISFDGNTTNSGYLNGYIDDLRITKGYARYTANFTAPTAALPDIGPI